MKYLFWIGLFSLIYWIARRVGKRTAQTRQPPAPRTPEQMVACVQCGINLPISESISSGKRFFCCVEHQQAAESQKN